MPKVLANDVEIEYEERGQGEPVIFLHGSGVDWRCWTPQIPVFSPHYRMIMPVMRGHGGSGYLPRTDHYHELMAHDLRHFMDALGIRRAPIVGLSMGAVVGLRFAHMYPEYVEKLVSVCGYSQLPTFGSGALLWLSNAIYSLMSMQTIMKVIDYGFQKVGANDLTRRVIRESIAIDKETFMKLKFVRFPNFTPELRHITAPTLVMGGDGIKFEAKASRILFEQIPDARLAIFKGGFDPLSTERQEIHDDMILDFLAGRPIKPYPGVTYQEKR
jgi:3-oxoadipate enol-lactonase